MMCGIIPFRIAPGMNFRSSASQMNWEICTTLSIPVFVRAD